MTIATLKGARHTDSGERLGMSKVDAMSDHQKISTLPSGAMTSETMAALRDMDKACVAAINLAASRGVPQGLIVGLLHGYAHVQTEIMMTRQEQPL